MTTDREPELDRYAAMRWNTPLSEPHAAELLERLDIPAATSVLDIGCGWGELLLRAVALSQPQSGRRGIGVDPDLDLLTRGRMLAADRGLEQRIRFVQAAVQSWTEPADRVLCIGAAHAWGGTAAALVALRKLTRPGGQLLFGDGCWETQPTPAAVDIFGDEVVPLASILDHAQVANWRVLYLDTADQREWDEFESSWRRGREDWLRDHADDTAAQAVRAELDARITEYVRDYRGVLGSPADLDLPASHLLCRPCGRGRDRSTSACGVGWPESGSRGRSIAGPGYRALRRALPGRVSKDASDLRPS